MYREVGIISGVVRVENLTRKLYGGPRWMRKSIRLLRKVSNVTVRNADGSQGAATDGPFDAIVMSGSVAEVPAALLQQLAVGGRLAAIVGDEPMMRATLITRTSDSSWTTTEPWDCNAPRLSGFAEPSRFKF